MRSVEEIYQNMKNDFAERAGFQPEDGCDLSVRLWAAAAQVQALDMQADWVLNQSFPQTASGAFLDRHAAMRGLSRIPAAKAVGTLRFFVKSAMSSELQVPIGTVCMTEAGQRFQTLETAVISAGELFADAPAEALEGGSSGNAAAGTVTLLMACPVSVTGCTNPAAFRGGSNEESDLALRNRILESYCRLPNGANAAWYETTAMNHDGVTAAKAVGRARGVGTVDVYIAAENGAPSPELLEEVQAELAEKREIGVDVQAKVPAVRTVNVRVEIQTARRFSEVKPLAEQAVGNFFTGRLLGRPVYLADLGNRLHAVDGVENYHILQPATDIEGSDTVLPVLGTLMVTEMEA